MPPTIQTKKRQSHFATVFQLNNGNKQSISLRSNQKEYSGVICGYGQCSKCSCQAYEGNYQVCGNCGHSYDSHY